MAEKILCPKCGAKMKSIAHDGTTVLSCGKCGHQLNVGTGKVTQTETIKPGEGAYTNCPSCGVRLRYKKNNGLQKLNCPFCEHEWRVQTDTGESLSEAVIGTDGWIVTTCQKCGAKNRVPGGKGNLLIRCGGCAHEYYLLGAPAEKKSAPKQEAKVKESAAPKQKAQAAPKPESESKKEKGPGFFDRMRAKAEERKEREAAEIKKAEDSFLIYLFGMKLIEGMVKRDFYDMISDPDFGGMDFDVEADGFVWKWFTRDWKLISGNPYFKFKDIKKVNREEWGADVIDKELEYVEFPAARRAMRDKLLTDYVGKIPYLDVNLKTGRVVFNGKPHKID